MIRKSRQNSHRSHKSVDYSKRNCQEGDIVGKIYQSTFIKRFQGKINIVTRQKGLKGILMKTYIPKIQNSKRYKHLETIETSGDCGKIVKNTSKTKTAPNTIETEQVSQNYNQSNFIINRRGSQECKDLKKVPNAITPFHLPRLNRLKNKKEEKKQKLVDIKSRQVHNDDKENKVKQLKTLR